MPKLSDERAAQVEGAESNGGFQLIAAGVHTVTLTDVEISPNPGPSGFHQWIWKYALVDSPGQTIWDFTSLSPKADWRIKQVFEAFGVPANTNTDDLIGKPVKLQVSMTTAQQGKNKGKMVNNIEEVVAYSGPVILNSGTRTANPGDF